MVEYIMLAMMAAVVIGMLFLRTNTAVAYLALCAGSVLLLSSGENIGLVASSLTSGMSSAATIAKFMLLFAPMTVCAVLLRRQVKKWLLLFSIVPAACAAFLGTVLAVPLLSGELQDTIKATNTWDMLVQYQEAFTGIGLVASIMLLSLTIKNKEKGKKKH